MRLAQSGGPSRGAAAPASPVEPEPGIVPMVEEPPDWAKRMKRHQSLSHGATLAAHAVKSGDSHGGGSSVNLSESNRS